MAQDYTKLTNTIIINETLLKLYSDISRGVGIDKVFPYVVLAQQFHLKPILGSVLLEYLQNAINNNELTDEDKALLIKIAPYLALSAQYLGLRGGLTYSIQDKGVTKESSDNSVSLTQKELGDYIKNTEDLADLSKTDLLKYLCTCGHPLWYPVNDCVCNQFNDEVIDTSSKVDYQIYFPRFNNNTKCSKC